MKLKGNTAFSHFLLTVLRGQILTEHVTVILENLGDTAIVKNLSMGIV